MDASLLALVLYAYPALVLVGAVRARARAGDAAARAALVVASAGTALVLAGAAAGALDALGTAMGFGAALAYTTYILVGDRVVAGRAAARALRARLHRRDGHVRARRGGRAGPSSPSPPRAGRWLGAIALVSTVGAVLAFFAGLERVGPSAASILSTLEPVVTVGLAAAAFGESLTRGPARRCRARARGGRGDAVACPARAVSVRVQVARRTSTAGR